MAAIKPLKLDSANYPANAQSGDFVDIPNGGTGAITATAARTALGVAIGTDVLAYSLDLSNLTALNSSAGIPVRTATNTWAVRTITGSTRVSVTNGGGVAGNPTIDLNTYTDSGAGTFLKLTRDTMGLVSGTTAVVLADIDTLISTTYAKLASPAFTGNPTAPTQTLGDNSTKLATTAYVDAMVNAGVVPWNAVALATTGNLTLSGEQTIDGTLTSASRILVWQQTTQSQNGIYVTAAGAWTRATDADAAAEFEAGKQLYVSGGTLYTGSVFANTNTTAITIGSTSITFTQVNGTTTISAGNGLTKTGNTIDAVGNAGRIVINANDIDLATGIATPGTYTKVTVDTYGRVTLGATATASDVGAQPLDAGLTSIAALTGGGSVHATGTDTFVMRTPTGSGGITITNADGVAGAPAYALTTGVVTPGTYGSVTVDTTGRVTAGSASAAVESTITAVSNQEAGTIVIGRAVYVFGSGQVKLANANAAGTRLVVGLVYDTSIASTATGNIATSGVVVATTGQWDVVTGQTGGLTAGSTYYLSNATNGALTTTAPTTGYSAPIGVAISTTRLKINIWQPVQL